jgi:hypothetical protein
MTAPNNSVPWIYITLRFLNFISLIIILEYAGFIVLEYTDFGILFSNMDEKKEDQTTLISFYFNFNTIPHQIVWQHDRESVRTAAPTDFEAILRFKDRYDRTPDFFILNFFDNQRRGIGKRSTLIVEDRVFDFDPVIGDVGDKASDQRVLAMIALQDDLIGVLKTLDVFFRKLRAHVYLLKLRCGA